MGLNVNVVKQYLKKSEGTGTVVHQLEKVINEITS